MPISNTMSSPPPVKSPQDHNPLINFDLGASMADIERRLEAARLDTAAEVLATPSAQLKPPIEVPPVATSPEASPPPSFESGFLAELARAAAQKQSANLSATQKLQARSQSLHDALSRIPGFFTPFIQFANGLEPDIPRIYRLDARTVFSNLKWHNASFDARKQDLSATALLANVTFSVNYHAAEPVLLTRPWNQLDALKSELASLKLRVVDESELDSKRPKQEWLQVRLAPDFPVYLRFIANYDKGHIDILSRNLLEFGISSFRIEAEEINTPLLEDLGRVLLGQTEKLPPHLRPL